MCAECMAAECGGSRTCTLRQLPPNACCPGVHPLSSQRPAGYAGQTSVTLSHHLTTQEYYSDIQRIGNPVARLKVLTVGVMAAAENVIQEQVVAAADEADE